MDTKAQSLTDILKGFLASSSNGEPTIGKQLIYELLKTAHEGLRKGDLTAFAMIVDMLKGEPEQKIQAQG